MNEALISVRDLTVAYDGTTALDSVSLDIYDDDFLGVIGPNGGGKTSLVRAILGNIPYRGTVAYAAELYRGGERLIGYLPQQQVFDRAFPISVAETVLSGLQGANVFAPATPLKSGGRHSSCSNAPASPRSPSVPSERFRAGRCSGRCYAGRSSPSRGC